MTVGLYVRLLTTLGAYSLLAMIQQIGAWRDLSEKIVQWKGEFFLLNKAGPSRDGFFGGSSLGREDLDPIAAIIRSYMEAERSGRALSRDV